MKTEFLRVGDTINTGEGYAKRITDVDFKAGKIWYGNNFNGFKSVKIEDIEPEQTNSVVENPNHWDAEYNHSYWKIK